MTYTETLDYIYSKLPMFQRQGASAYKASLETTIALDSHFNSPHKNFRTIHIAGTNGKGSTSHMLASIMQEQGYNTGLYTSPHLLDFRERIKTNGQMIQKEYVVAFIEKAKQLIEKLNPSFFEITVAMAFQYFADSMVDIAIIEVGMGGRLDSTNIITPIVSVITNISKDHCQFLGNTIEQIAEEKGGIIKPNVPIVLGEKNDSTTMVFQRLAENKKAEITYAISASHFEGLPIKITPDLKGNYQKKNIATVLATCETINSKMPAFISKQSIIKGISNTIKNTGLQGRWQIVSQKPLTICDTAHNYGGIQLAMNQLCSLKKQMHILWGMVSDKDISEILPLMPKQAQYYITQPSINRAMPRNELNELFIKNKYTTTVHADTYNAYTHAKAAAADEDVIYIGGSTFIVADFLSDIKNY